MIRYKTSNRIIFHFTGRKVHFLRKKFVLNFEKFGEEICAQKAVFVLELACTFFIASYSKFYDSNFAALCGFIISEMFFFALLVEINVKKTSVQLISTVMTASLAAISVLYFIIYGTFDTFYCCFSAKIG